jgi:hypothetical protein
LLVVAVLCGCGGGDPVRVTGEDPVVLTFQELPGRLMIPDTTWGGEIRYDASSGCLYLWMADAVPSQLLLVWPDGTEPLVADGRRGVELPGYGGLYEGDRVTVRGASLDLAAWGRSDGLDPSEFPELEGLEAAAAACGADATALVVVELLED